MNAISFEELETPAYNEATVLAAKKAKESPLPCGCPGSACLSIPSSTGMPPYRMPLTDIPATNLPTLLINHKSHHIFPD